VWYYKCNTHSKINLNASKLHIQFENILKGLSLPETYITRIQSRLQQRIKNSELSNRNHLVDMEKGLIAVEIKLRNLQDSFLLGTFSKEEYTEWKGNSALKKQNSKTRSHS
jgi:hypothetical protein